MYVRTYVLTYLLTYLLTYVLLVRGGRTSVDRGSVCTRAARGGSDMYI